MLARRDVEEKFRAGVDADVRSVVHDDTLCVDKGFVGWRLLDKLLCCRVRVLCDSDVLLGAVA